MITSTSTSAITCPPICIDSPHPAIRLALFAYLESRGWNTSLGVGSTSAQFRLRLPKYLRRTRIRSLLPLGLPTSPAMAVGPRESDVHLEIAFDHARLGSAITVVSPLRARSVATAERLEVMGFRACAHVGEATRGELAVPVSLWGCAAGALGLIARAASGEEQVDVRAVPGLLTPVLRIPDPKAAPARGSPRVVVASDRPFVAQNLVRRLEVLGVPADVGPEAPTVENSDDRIGLAIQGTMDSGDAARRLDEVRSALGALLHDPRFGPAPVAQEVPSCPCGAPGIRADAPGVPERLVPHVLVTVPSRAWDWRPLGSDSLHEVAFELHASDEGVHAAASEALAAAGVPAHRIQRCTFGACCLGRAAKVAIGHLRHEDLRARVDAAIQAVSARHQALEGGDPIARVPSEALDRVVFLLPATGLTLARTRLLATLQAAFAVPQRGLLTVLRAHLEARAERRGPAVLSVERAVPAFEVAERWARVFDMYLPRLPEGAGGPHVPDASLLARYCLDGTLAAALRFTAWSLHLREPILLDGPPAASKTSLFSFLGALCRLPVVRLSMKQDTDTSHLVGAYRPNLTSQTPFCLWRDGPLPRVMIDGGLLVLDELNIVHASAVVEAILPALERPPTLYLEEADPPRLLGGSGAPVHPLFRIAATMNEVTTGGGRATLSRALRDRFSRFSAAAPGETDLVARLRFLVDGSAPEVAVAGRVYRGVSTRTPDHPRLAAVAGIDDFLAALASTLVGLDKAATGGPGEGQRTLGARRREPYSFTWRKLEAALAALDAQVEAGIRGEAAMRDVVDRYLMQAVDACDREAVAKVLDAHGIGPSVWRLGRPTLRGMPRIS